MITLAPGLELPDDAVTKAYALLGMKGSGKSNAAVVMAEEFYAASIPFVVVDPKGDWWGIRSGARGGAGGGIPAVIFGGLHADVPIDSTAGGTIAELIVREHLTCVIDTSEFTKGESIRFLEVFFDRLYREKNRASFPMHVFLEEADDYVPQKVYGEVAKLVRAVEVIVKRGRQRGLGITLASQRSASVNKDVLSQTDTLVALRTTAPQDRKAIGLWLTWHAGDTSKILDELPTLDDGDAWVSSPAQLRILERVHFRRRRTFDSGATPELGEKVKPATLADIDLVAVTAALASQIERAKADDPRELRAEIARLRREHAEHPRVTEKRVDVPVPFVPPEVPRALTKALTIIDAALGDLRAGRDEIAASLAKLESARPAGMPPPAARGGAGRAPGVSASPRPAAASIDADARRDVARMEDRVSPNRDERSIGASELKLLTALGQSAGGELTKRKLAVLTGYKVSGGRFGNLLGALRTGGLVEGRDPVRITDSGRRVLGPVETPPTGPELLEWWLARSDVTDFGPRTKELLRVVVEHEPDGIDKAELAERMGYEPTGGRFGNVVGRLRTLGLVAPATGPTIRLSDEFAEAIASVTAAKRRIVYVTLDDVVEADRNPKGHADTVIAESIDRFGFVEPMVADERTGKLVAGHGRLAQLRARRDAGLEAPDGVVVVKGVWTVPVVRGWASSDDAEAHALGVAINRATELGGWTDDLAPLLAELAGSGLGLAGVGFDHGDVDRLLAELGTPPEPKAGRDHEGDDSPIGPASRPFTRRGNVWHCGDHRVMCGDSFDAEDRAALLGDVVPDVALMDPPFAIYGSASGISASVADDKMVRPFFEQLGRTIADLMPPFAHVYTCCDWRSYATLWDGFRSAGLTPKNCLVWDKGSFGLGSNWPNTHEFVAFHAKLPPDRAMTSARKTGQRQVLNHPNILRYPRVRGDEREHNAAKPVAMFAEILEVSSDPGGVVMDLFGGSGTVLAAAIVAGRRSFTMEYEPGWVDVTCRRYQRLTGEAPTLDGVPHDFTVLETS